MTPAQQRELQTRRAVADRVRKCCVPAERLNLAVALVRKVASTSILAELLRAQGRLPSSFNAEDVYAVKTGHISPRAAHEQGFVVAAFVRNPFDRLVSVWHGKVYSPEYVRVKPRLLSLGFRKGMDFPEFVRRVCAHRDHELHLVPQSHFLGEGYERYGFLGRFERFQEDWECLQKLVPGLGALQHLNATDRERYRAFYDTRTREIAQGLYAEDLERFGYSF